RGGGGSSSEDTSEDSSDGVCPWTCVSCDSIGVAGRRLPASSGASCCAMGGGGGVVCAGVCPLPKTSNGEAGRDDCPMGTAGISLPNVLTDSASSAAEAAGTTNVFWQAGQRPVRPALSSGA